MRPNSSESASSPKNISGVRQSNINEGMILEKFKKIEEKHTRHIHQEKKDSLLDAESPLDKKTDNKINSEIRTETERRINKKVEQPSSSAIMSQENRTESPASREEFSANLNVWNGTDPSDRLEYNHSSSDNDKENTLLVFEKARNPNADNPLDMAPPEDESPFKQTKISRERRQEIRTMRKEEEERPMIFFDKNNRVPYQETKDSSEKEESNETIGDMTPGEDENANSPSSDENANSSSGSDRRGAVLHEILDWTKHIAIAVAIGLLLVIFVVQRNVVVGSSMEPNLYDADQLFVEKVSKLFPSGISYGDIITINAEGLAGHSGDKNIIKRVIGVPGDTVDIKKDGVYRNGVKLTEPYLSGVVTDPRDPSYSHVTLSDNQYYVLGDNRTVSLDSRVFGPINKSRIIGEVLLRFYPLNKIGRP